MTPKWIQTTYDDLLTLFRADQLVPGETYEFEYRTKHLIFGSSDLNVGPVERLLVVAANGHEFFKEAKSLDFPKDYIEYSFESNVCEDSVTPRNGKITKRIDINGNETPFDFRAVLHRRYSVSANTWQPGTRYDKYTVVKVGSKLYRYAAVSALGPSDPNLSPENNSLWRLYVDLEKNPYPFWKHYVGNAPGETPGYAKPETLIFSDDHMDFYTFTDKYGNQRSDWFRDIKMAVCNEFPYNNIVMIETGPNQSFNNQFSGRCREMTILENFQDNGSIEHSHQLIIASNCKLNRIRQASKLVIDENFTENIMHHRIAFDHFGKNVTGNHFLGECVGTTLGNGFAQNTIGIDFSFCLTGQGSYNTIGNFVWDSYLPDGFSNNNVFCKVQDVVFPSIQDTTIRTNGFDYWIERFDGSAVSFEKIVNPTLE